MQRTVKTGVIGCGVVSLSHIDSYLQIEGSELVAICDLRKDRIEAARERHPDLTAKAYTSVDALLAESDVEAVSICTDHASHEEIFRKCLEAGKHVICEKALTTNRASLERMVRMGRESNLVTTGIFQHRFDSVYRACREIIEEELLGTLLTVSIQHQAFRANEYYTQDAWRGTWSGEGGSLLINQSIHFLDILQWLTGGVRSVSAHLDNLAHGNVIETEDTAAISMELGNGALATFAASTGSHRTWDSYMQLIGTDGDLHLENQTVTRCTHRDSAMAEKIQKRLGGIDDETGVARAKEYYGPSHPAQIEDFLNAVRSGGKPFVSLEDAAETVALVLAIYESAKKRQTVNL
jgi:UDP-N-acetyl-2-amino-2-deoxyglucuronate dehydrogenase